MRARLPGLEALRPYAWLVVAVGLAATFEAALIARSPAISADGITFINIARLIPDGAAAACRDHDQHPGYPAMIVACRQLLAGDLRAEDPAGWALAAQTASAICGVLSIVVMWLIARRLFDTYIANIAAIVFAVLPMVRRNAADAMSDTPHVLFYLLATLLACEALARRRAVWFVATGAASAAAYWIRPEGLEIALVTASLVVVWAVNRARTAETPWAPLSWAAAVLASAALVVAPYALVSGKFTSKQLPFAKRQPVPTYVAQQYGSMKHGGPSGAAPQAVEPPAARTLKVIAGLIAGALNEFCKSMAQGFKFVFLPLYFVGHIELVRRKANAWHVALFAALGALHTIVLIGVYFLSGYIDHRHVIPLVALATPFVALGVVYVGGLLVALGRRNEFELPPAWCAATVVVACSAIVLPWTVRPLNTEFQPVLQATAWIHSRLDPGAGVISNSPYVPFYGCVPTATLTKSTAEIQMAIAYGDPSIAFDYALLHVNAYDFNPAWSGQLARDYQAVFALADPRPKRREVKVVVYARKQGSRLVDSPMPPSKRNERKNYR